MPVMLVVIVLAGLLGGIAAGEAQTWYGWHPLVCPVRGRRRP